MRTGILLSLARIWMSLCGLGITIAALSFTDPATFGLFAIASSVGLLFCMLLGSGSYEMTLARTVDPAEAHAFASTTGLVFAGLLGLLALAADRAGMPVMTLTFLAYAVNCVGWGAINTADAIAVRDGHAHRILIANGAGDTVNLAVAVAGLLAGLGIEALILAKLAQSIVQYSAFCAAGGRWPLPSLRQRNVRSGIGAFGAYLLPRMSGWAESYAADLFIGALLSPAASGQFRLAARFTSAFQSVILNSLNLVMIAEIGKRASDALKTSWMLRITPQAVVVAGLASTAFALVVCAALVHFREGAWAEAGLVVLFIAAATPAQVVGGAVIALLTGRQAHRRLADIQVLRLLGTTGGLIAGALVSTVASAAGRSIANILVTAATVSAVLQQPSHVRLVVGVLVRQSLVGLAVAGLALALARYMPGGLARPTTLAMLFAAFLALQSLLTFAHLHVAAKEALQLRLLRR